MSETKVKHPVSVEGHDSLEELANAIGTMRYDKVAEFLGYLTQYVKNEAEKDLASGKTKLSTKLYLASEALSRAQEEIDSAWKICKLYMKEE